LDLSEVRLRVALSDPLVDQDWRSLPDQAKLALLAKLRKVAPLPGAAAILRRDDPVEFFRDVLGWEPTAAALAHGYTDPITPDQRLVVESVRDHRRTAVPAGHGVGKTFLVAGTALWFLLSQEDSIVLTTAPTWNQVESIMWREIHRAHRRAKLSLPGTLNQTELRLNERWFALGLSTDDSSRFQGYHGRRILVILDEATGVRPEIWEAIEGVTVRPDDRIIAIGNPTDPVSDFKAACDSGLWNVIRLDCRQHPNVVENDPEIIPGAVTKEWVEEREIEYGGENSPLFQARVAGIWPDQSANSLISLSWVAQAQSRRVPDPPDRRGVALGLDVAGTGDDLTVLSKIENSRWDVAHWHTGKDVMEGVSAARRVAAETGARILVVDDTGIGQGLSARIRQMQREGQFPKGCRIVAVNFGASAWREDLYRHTKDEMYWFARERLRLQDLTLPTDRELLRLGLPRGSSVVSQLTAPIYVQTATGKINVLDKRDGREDTKTLPTKSPDFAHSLILACWAWQFIRADKREEPAKTTREIRSREFHEDVAKRLKELAKFGARRERRLKKARMW
jgi:phage terminase large subunit